VEWYGLEIAGLDLGSGLIMGVWLTDLGIESFNAFSELFKRLYDLSV
jgi:hypothetical protein